MIVLQNVTKVYPSGTVALDDVSLQIDEREFVFLVGPSGAGKTTLIRLINRDTTPDSGSVFVENISDDVNFVRAVFPGPEAFGTDGMYVTHPRSVGVTMGYVF